MAEQRTAAEVARFIADALEDDGLSYAIGGAIALGFYSPPRATVDVDVNIFVAVDREIPRALAALDAAGFTPNEALPALQARALAEGQFRGTVDGMRVDVFVPAIPYYEEIAAHRRQAVLFDRPLWIVGAEDLVVLKLLFFRRKDLADVEALLRDQGVSLDRSYVCAKLAELVGPDDERLVAFAAIAQDVDSETAD